MNRIAANLLSALCLVIATAAQAADPTFPAVVALEYRGGRVLCSGVVLTDRLVLTAAHCVCRERPLNAFVGQSVFPTSNPGWQLRVDLQLDRPSFFVDDFCERYAADPAKAMGGSDLALLRFVRPLSREIHDYLLQDGQPSQGGQSFDKVFGVGFGESINFWRPGRKTHAEVDIIARLCSAEDEQRKGCKAGIEMLAARPPHDTCFADSGGGLYGIDQQGTLHLIGITARAMKDSPNNMCGGGGIYTSVESPIVRAWLMKKITASLNVDEHANPRDAR